MKQLNLTEIKYNFDKICLQKKFKSVLHESIENIEDDDFLLSVIEIIDSKYGHSTIPKVSDAKMKRILELDDQIEKGNFLTNEDADKLVDE